LLLAACGDTRESRYFTLSPTPPAAATAAGRTPLRLTYLHLPALYDRPQMVRRLGPQAVDIDEFDRWGEPLERMTARILAEDLSLRRPLGAGPLPPPDQMPRLRVTIDDFMADSSGTARLAGRWREDGRGGDFAFTQPTSGAGPEAMAAAMSALLGRLADEIDGKASAESGAKPDSVSAPTSDGDEPLRRTP
jgi:uncharacterized lipoprotein YmbA